MRRAAGPACRAAATTWYGPRQLLRRPLSRRGGLLPLLTFSDDLVRGAEPATVEESIRRPPSRRPSRSLQHDAV